MSTTAEDVRVEPSSGSGDGGGGYGLALAFGFFALVGVCLSIAALVVALSRPTTGGEAASPVNGTINLSEFAIVGDLELPAGDVTLTVTNGGSQVHNLALEDGPTTPDLQSGQTATLALGELGPGNYTLFCSIPGHADSGMRTTLVISEGGDAAAGADHGAHGDEMDYAEMDRLMLESIAAFPAATEGRGNEALEATIAADGAKEFELTAAITDWEVEPGKVVKAWSYNGVVPGPMIKVAQGDRVRVTVHNELPLSTDIHHHGLDLPNDMDGVAGITQEPVLPGESFTYEFTATKKAVGMYHAHIHGQLQVPNGLFGAFIIGDVDLPRGRTISGVTIPADLTVSQELPMVLNDAGTIGLTLNGKSFPATEPLSAKVGDWVLVHYMNEGLQLHPMHPHQFPQLVVARDGIPLDVPYFADTLTVAPGERYSVLMHIDKPGVWVWHCHILNHVEREEGMFGMVTAIVVE